ncbi:hypothetical protein FOZ62_019760, partial [Perkinsus olseni]
ERAWSTTMARLGESRGSDASESTGRERQRCSNLGLHSAEFSVSEGEESDARSEYSARVDDTEVSASIWAHALTTFSVRSAPAADQQALSRPLENLFEGRDDFAGLEEIDLEAPQRSVSETRVHSSVTQEADSLPEGEAAATPSSRGDAQRGELRHAMLEHWKWTVRECCKACMG